MKTKTLLLVFTASILLQACGSSDDTSSSSNSLASSAKTSSSASQVNAQLLYSEQGCATCHGPQGDNGDYPIKIAKWDAATLTQKIRLDMPLGNPSLCDALCAQTLANYILSWDQSPPAGDTVFALNIGGPAMTTSAGVRYENDSDFAQGTLGSSTDPVTNTSEPQLYMSDRWATELTYELDVEPGVYQLTLHFAENYWQRSGARVFDVFVEGLKVASAIDVYAAVGFKQAHNLVLSKLPIQDGALSLKLVATTDNVSLAGILVLTENSVAEEYQDDPQRVGTMPLRRLTRREYNNTVKDLLLINQNATDLVVFPAEPKTDFPFPRFADAMSTLEMEKFAEAAETLAGLTDLQKHLPCTTQNRTCAQTFIESFGARAYRRPLINEEIQRLLNLYDSAQSMSDAAFDSSIRLVIQALLQSPGFLYRWELGRGTPTNVGRYIQLNNYELASRLAYFIWRSMPDEALFTAAAQGTLTSDSGIRTQVKRMLASSKAYESIAFFPEYWLHYEGLAEQDKSAVAYPMFNDTLKQAMLEESRRFSEQVLLKGDGLFSSLLINSEAYINSLLANLYGLNGVTGTDYRWVDLAAADRSGLLTRAAFLAATGAADGSLPPKRGVTIYKNMLCREVPPPPANIPNPDPASAGGTTRERFEAHASNPCASACHVLFDDMGFAFEHYGGIGDFRTLDNNIPVDSSGTISVDGSTLTFDDAGGLSTILAHSDDAQSCFAENWLKYALDRNIDEPLDSPSVTQSIQAFKAANGNVRTLIEAIAVSRSFRYRVPSPGSQLPY